MFMTASCPPEVIDVKEKTRRKSIRLLLVGITNFLLAYKRLSLICCTHPGYAFKIRGFIFVDVLTCIKN